MVQIKRVLNRKDAYSVLLALVLGGLVSNLLYQWTLDLGFRFVKAGVDPVTGESYMSPLARGGIGDNYVRPLVALVAGIIIVECAMWLIVFFNDQMTSNKSSKK